MKPRNLVISVALQLFAYPADSSSGLQTKIDCFTLFRTTRKKAPIAITEELGTSPTFQNKYFDPLSFATEDNFSLLREAELKHGRVAMLAIFGNTIPELFRDQIVPSETFLSPSNALIFQNTPTGIKALEVVPIWGWLQIIFFIGVLETKVFIQRNENDMPGDYQVGYFGLRDKTKHER